ncbi:hypothetical protein HBH82_231370 [Parastagonospora nodorum]|nr:hypothetical protein HBH82_231370 [Parastagonospora nodorum]KAH4661419.1 hypothetical protein HBH78_223400 [Parastagonospora nodorum]KAH4691687.1 hypothetical protein HBH67_239610 [Parastagonospora nodorum]KAH4755686.1 hypothetical protein HBH63_230120 [Parastagonospora nodorum]KAH4769797.1 hypothetical protein HBH62_228840 [Parastagonospora nodorum]
MRLRDLLAVTTVIALVRADCYGITTGMYGQSMTGAGIAVNDFCAHDLAEFWVAWKGRSGWTLRSEDCELRLTDEINGCTLGGRNFEAD